MIGRIVGFGCLIALAVPAVHAQAPDLDRMDIVEKSVPDGPVANVNGRTIERIDFIRFYHNELMRVMGENAGQDVPDGARAQLALWCVGTLVERELLYDEAQRRGITVEPDRVEKAWDAQLSQMKESLKEREGKPADEQEILKRMGYGKREDVLADLRRALVTEKMRATIIREKGVSVSDEEIRAVYDAQKQDYSSPGRMHLRQIFIDPRKVPGSAGEKDGIARKKAEDTLNRIYAGQRFASVARNVSDAPDAEDGGDMGFVPVKELPPFMVNAAMGMKPGEISDVLKSEFGYHIVELVEFEQPEEIAFDAAAPLIRQKLLNEKGADVVHAYCDELIQNGATVRVFLELQKNLALNGALADSTGG